MRRSTFALTMAVVLSTAASSRASLTPSEAEQVRRAIVTASDPGRVRALVARPDLSPDEAAAAVGAPMKTTALDANHLAFLHDLVFGDTPDSSRPVLLVAVLRGVLARADALIAQHPLDLERTPAALAELQRAYAYVEQVAAAAPAANVPASTRTECATALAGHEAHNAAVLSPQATVGPAVALVRAQAAIAYLDLAPDGATRRIDVADGLGLTGARRALLVERGLLALDAGGPDARIASLRALLDRLPALRDGLEAIVVGHDAAGLAARDGAILATGDDPGGAAGPTLLWGADVRLPPGDGWSTAVARGLATVAVSRAAARNDTLRAQIERDGGVSGVAAMTAMLILNGPLAVDAAAARLLAGRGESAACLADAIAALAVFAPAPAGEGLSIAVGSAKTAGAPATKLTRVVLGPQGAATSFRLENRGWVFERDAGGALKGLRRDGLPVTASMLTAARP
jgi:hypothetical protein